MINTGQMLLVLGALTIFSLTLPSLNQSLLYNDRTLIATNAEMAAMSLAEKVLAEAGAMAFDEVCLTTKPQLTSQLTNINALGPESGESYPQFDDMDDFHGATIRDSITMPSVLFNINSSVSYIDPLNPTTEVGYKTFVKKLVVTVTGPYLINPASEQNVQIKMEQLYSFY
ncbi:hypothetical protein CEE37_10655 [candidate division LCP-89 bacterium B3_LCP]|uniref:Type 4 fimbrial biogenesis protein PilX N-terminal domain-containing protein n=1 Tax=candidate division LCP-89 bacterium B3_LCP TaxID=2012998 RepID=A0A532UXQ4_UNCL8|nr:MAG: hypothetical protein CEE37_10655 [candidate division LCP-89 bacterium B3_LCP]